MNAETSIRKAIQATVNAIPGVRFWDNQIYEGSTPTSKWTKAGLGRGSADLIGCVNGKFVAWEVKTSTGRQDRDQKSWQIAVESCTGVYQIVRSVDEALMALAGMGVDITLAQGTLAARRRNGMRLADE